MTKGRGKKVIQEAEEEQKKEDWADADDDAEDNFPMDFDGEDGFDKGVPDFTRLPAPKAAPMTFTMADSEDDLADLTSIVAQAEGKTKALQAEMQAESEKVEKRLNAQSEAIKALANQLAGQEEALRQPGEQMRKQGEQMSAMALMMGRMETMLSQLAPSNPDDRAPKQQKTTA